MNTENNSFISLKIQPCQYTKKYFSVKPYEKYKDELEEQVIRRIPTTFSGRKFDDSLIWGELRAIITENVI